MAINKRAQPSGLKANPVGSSQDKDLDKLSLEALRGSKAQLSEKPLGLSINKVIEQGTQDKLETSSPSKVSCHQILRIGELDVPIFGVIEQGSGRKPPGSGYVQATLRLSRLPAVDTFLCIDTGADRTVCTSQFIIHHFGEQAIYKLKKAPENKPEFKSATGHPLDLLGSVKMTITMGTYTFEHRIVVFNHCLLYTSDAADE